MREGRVQIGYCLSRCTANDDHSSPASKVLAKAATLHALLLLPTEHVPSKRCSPASPLAPILPYRARYPTLSFLSSRLQWLHCSFHLH